MRGSRAGCDSNCGDETPGGCHAAACMAIATRRGRLHRLFVAQGQDRAFARDLDRVPGDGADGDGERQQAAITKGAGPRSIRASKPLSQSRITHQAAGQAIRLAISTGLQNCQTSRRTMSRVRAPKHLADADLPGAPLGGEGGQAEQAEAGDQHREQGEGGEGCARAASAA